MSSIEYQIKNNASPLSQDFDRLKAEGLGYIQMHSDTSWTNLNDSDPGVTILEQLCFALTELGYCNDFSIRDILTKANGELTLEDQFYLPEQILTTSAISANDYRKYLIDGIAALTNAVLKIQPDSDLPQPLKILFQSSSENSETLDTLADEVYYYLNKSRNLAQLFDQPSRLIPKLFLLRFSLDVTDETELPQILANIGSAISEYILPAVSPKGFSVLIAEGYSTDDLYDGPALLHGFIPDAALGSKTDQIDTFTLIDVMQAVEGVNAVKSMQLAFEYSSSSSSSSSGEVNSDSDFSGDSSSVSGNTNSDYVWLSSVTCQPDEILTPDLAASYAKNLITVTVNGMAPSALPPIGDLSASQLPSHDESVSYTSSTEEEKRLQPGNFRDIGSYYSIQNTFPGIYAVGENSVSENANDYTIALSRQLKGYLTLFDQLLANQFSQLAYVPLLFSFRNALTGTPRDRYEYFTKKNHFDFDRQIYPVPYLRFSPTYFYQSLYDVPSIWPLFKDYQSYTYSILPEDTKLIEKKGREKYIRSPYNAYIHGLMMIMEDDEIGCARRNKLLDHLLARHGESPAEFDALIRGSMYAGDTDMDKVIFKSLYLQNLALLTYYRCKAYNFLGADSLSGTYIVMPASGSSSPVVLPMQRLENKAHRIARIRTSDFIVNTAAINELEKIPASDFVNYSAIELLLSLLLGLNPLYANFINHPHEADSGKNSSEQPDVPSDTDVMVRQALWLIEWRKGSILTETALLLQSLLFGARVIVNGNNYDFKNASYEVLKALAAAMSYYGQTGDFDPALEIIHTYSETTGSLSGLSVSSSGSGIAGAETFTYTLEIYASDPVLQQDLIVPVAFFANDLLFLFPQYIPTLNTDAFKGRANKIIQSRLSVNLESQLCLFDSDQGERLIPAYITWHDNLRFLDPSTLPAGVTLQQAQQQRKKDTTASAFELMKCICSILNNTNS
ncbi:MAG: hypothetical protein IM638_07750 [Bacteroidetes bacterium]|nr:hypothetical protein [Bacteroidota bacterium]